MNGTQSGCSRVIGKWASQALFELLLTTQALSAPQPFGLVFLSQSGPLTLVLCKHGFGKQRVPDVCYCVTSRVVVLQVHAQGYEFCCGQWGPCGFGEICLADHVLHALGMPCLLLL